jgi:hypothetical protein
MEGDGVPIRQQMLTSDERLENGSIPFDYQPRHVREMLPVSGDQSLIVGEADSRDQGIHVADRTAKTEQICFSPSEMLRRCLIQFQHKQ